MERNGLLAINIFCTRALSLRDLGQTVKCQSNSVRVQEIEENKMSFVVEIDLELSWQCKEDYPVSCLKMHASIQTQIPTYGSFSSILFWYCHSNGQFKPMEQGTEDLCCT